MWTEAHLCVCVYIYTHTHTYTHSLSLLKCPPFNLFGDRVCVCVCVRQRIICRYSPSTTWNLVSDQTLQHVLSPTKLSNTQNIIIFVLYSNVLIESDLNVKSKLQNSYRDTSRYNLKINL